MNRQLKYEADVVVAGAGTAGAVAAIAAADSGAQVLLIEQLGGAGGSGCYGLVTPLMHTGIVGNPMCSYVANELNERMVALGAAMGDGSAFDPGMLCVALEQMLMERGVRTLFHTTVTGAQMERGRVTRLLISNKSGGGEAVGRAYIDATGDADICALLGLETHKGDEHTGKNQPMSLRYVIGGVRLRAFWEDICESASPGEAAPPMPEYFSGAVTDGDGRVWPYTPLFERAIAAGDLTHDDQVYWQFFTLPGRPDCVAFNCPEFFDIHDADDAESLTRVQMTGKQAILRQLLFYRKYIPGFENAYIAQIAQMVGVRESRRANTDYIVTVEDLVSHRKFEDAVCQSNYPVDVHGRVLRVSGLGKNESEPPYYEIPFRSLIVKGVNNLLVAGRSIGSEFAAQSSMRIMPTCRAMGEACGIAAALACVNDAVDIRAIRGADVRAEMQRRGAVFARA